MKNEMVDKVYLALELTRLYIPERNPNVLFGRGYVKDTFEYFLKELTDIESISDYAQLKEELEETKIAYNNLREELKNKATMLCRGKLESIEEILQQCKSDMEPYVYERLTNALK